MKKTALLILLTIGSLLAHAQQPPAESGAVLGFETAKIDLGKVSKDEPKIIKFVYSNTGTKPLLITNVDVSCGCIAPEWSKQPLLPDRQDAITVRFDPRTKQGYTLLSLYVTSNSTNGLQIVRIQAEVE